MNQMLGQVPSGWQMSRPILPSQAASRSQDVSEKSTTNSFESILKRQQRKTDPASEGQQLRFSKHANKRLAQREIDLSETQLRRLQEGTLKAREKGITDSLVMVDELAFIVNTKSNIVITAVNDSDDSIFTNIDGAVIS